MMVMREPSAPPPAALWWTNALLAVSQVKTSGANRSSSVGPGTGPQPGAAGGQLLWLHKHGGKEKSSGPGQIPSEEALRASLCCCEKEALGSRVSVSQSVSR